jgi:hypothetical protein
LAAVIINTTPGVDEPVKPTDIFITAFDDLEPEPVRPPIPPEQWKIEKQRLDKLFAKIENGKS